MFLKPPANEETLESFRFYDERTTTSYEIFSYNKSEDVSQTSVIRDFTVYDAFVNENTTKQQYHWLKEEK